MIPADVSASDRGKSNIVSRYLFPPNKQTAHKAKNCIIGPITVLSFPPSWAVAACVRIATVSSIQAKA